MKTINIITTENNFVQDIETFCIVEEQLEDEVVKKMEDRFELLISNFVSEDIDDIESIIEDGYFEYNGITFQIFWSYCEM